MKHSYFFMIIFVALPWALFAQTPPTPTKVFALASFYYVPDIHLTWQGDNSLGSSSYRLYRSDGDTTHFQLVAATYYSGYNDFQILAGQTYYYYVTAVVVRDTSHFESDPSVVVSASAGSQGGGRRHNHGTIAGRAVDSLTGRAIPAVQIAFYRFSSPGLPVQKILTDGSGHYKAALDTGTYILKATPPLGGGTSSATYQLKWYSNATDVSHADRIHVDDSSRVVADFELAPTVAPTPAIVRGKVRDSSGAAIRGATVAILFSLQEMSEQSSSNDDLPGTGKEDMDVGGMGHSEGVAWKGLTDSNGSYGATVRSGHAYVVLAAKEGYNPQFFDHQSNPLSANVIRVGSDVSGIDFNLARVNSSEQFSVSGTVRDSTSLRIPSRVVLIPLRHQFSSVPVLFAFTDSLGSFTIHHVRAGKYFALAIPFGRFAPAYFRSGSYGLSRWQLADTISVSSIVSGIDIGVVPTNSGGLARLSGRVRTGGVPTGGAIIYATADDGSLLDYGITDNNGDYSLNGMPPGRALLTADLEGFQSSQSSVSVAAGSLALSGIDLVLAPVSVTSVSSAGEVPLAFALDQNYPNPFNPSTRIAYTLPVAGDVSLKLYNVIGQLVTTLFEGPESPGQYVVTWNGKDNRGKQVTSGLYFYRLQAGNFAATKKLLLLK